MLIPICDILLVEHRQCRCGSISAAPSPLRHRLYRAPIGELDKIVITVPPVGESLGNGPYADSLTRKDVTIQVAHCESCWNQDVSFDEVLAYRPERPVVQPLGHLNGNGATKLQLLVPPKLEDL